MATRKPTDKGAPSGASERDGLGRRGVVAAKEPTGKDAAKVARDTPGTASHQQVGQAPWELPADALSSIPAHDRDLYIFFAVTAAQHCLVHWGRSGNGIFVWRAWRCLQQVPNPPAHLVEVINDYLDKASKGLLIADTPTAIAQALWLSNASGARGEGNASANPQSADTYFLERYKFLLEGSYRDPQDGTFPTLRPVKKVDVYKRLGEETGLSEGAVKQRILRLLERGQYKNRSRKR